MRACVSVLGIVSLSVASVRAEPPENAAHMRWAHSWSEAQAEAKERNVPIMIVVGSDT